MTEENLDSTPSPTIPMDKPESEDSLGRILMRMEKKLSSSQADALWEEFHPLLEDFRQRILALLNPIQGIDSLCRLADSLRCAQQGDKRAKRTKDASAWHDTLVDAMKRIGIEIIGSNELIGQMADPKIVRIRKTSPAAADLPPGAITEILSYGAQVGSCVLRPAEVAIIAYSEKETCHHV
ncbi:MAG: hypothetical protein AB1656_24610 [Candidatus Omnitrophota bacterium]